MPDALKLERAVDQQTRVFRAKGYTRKRATEAAREYFADDIKRFQQSLPYIQRMKAGVLKAQEPEKPREEIPTAYI